MQRVEIARQPTRGRPLDQQPQVAPRFLRGGAEIIVLDVEPADDDPLAVLPRIGERQLLVVAQQIAAPEPGREAAHGYAGLA